MLLIEGPHLLDAALKAGLRATEVFATPEFLGSGHPILGRLSLPPTTVSAAILDRVADSDSPRGLVALVESPCWDPTWFGSAPRELPIVYGDRLQDPGNVGALARVVEASGSAGLVLGPGSAPPTHPRALRASAGSLLRIAVASGIAPERLDEAAGSRQWVALSAAGGRDLYQLDDQVDLSTPMVLCLGSEGVGLSPEVAARCRLTVTIPMASAAESLNVAVAAGVALFELRRRRRETGRVSRPIPNRDAGAAPG